MPRICKEKSWNKMWELLYFCVSSRLRSIQAYRSQVLGFHQNTEEESTFALKALLCECELCKAKEPLSIHCIHEYIWAVPWVLKIYGSEKESTEHAASQLWSSISSLAEPHCLRGRLLHLPHRPHLAHALRWPPAQAEHELIAGKLQTAWGSRGSKGFKPVVCTGCST